MEIYELIFDLGITFKLTQHKLKKHSKRLPQQPKIINLSLIFERSGILSASYNL